MTNDKFRISRIDPHSAEAEHWAGKLHELVEPFTHSMKHQRRRFRLPDDAITLVAEDTSQPGADGEPKHVGSVVLKRLLPGEEQSANLPEGTRYGEIKRMIVIKEYQGTGVAAQLLRAAQQIGKDELGLQCITVETLTTLGYAQRFYEKSGFRKREVFGVYHADDSVCYEKFV